MILLDIVHRSYSIYGTSPVGSAAAIRGAALVHLGVTKHDGNLLDFSHRNGNIIGISSGYNENITKVNPIHLKIMLKYIEQTASRNGDLL